MTSRLDTYFSMTYSMSNPSNSFCKRQVATRLAFFPLVGVEISELANNIFNAPFDAGTKVSIMAGKKVFSGSPQTTWEGKWQPLETLKKVARLIIGFLVTLVLGWSVPVWNHWVHEKLKLITPQPPYAIQHPHQGPRPHSVHPAASKTSGQQNVVAPGAVTSIVSTASANVPVPASTLSARGSSGTPVQATLAADPLDTSGAPASAGTGKTTVAALVPESSAAPTPAPAPAPTGIASKIAALTAAADEQAKAAEKERAANAFLAASKHKPVVPIAGTSTTVVPVSATPSSPKVGATPAAVTPITVKAEPDSPDAAATPAAAAETGSPKAGKATPALVPAASEEPGATDPSAPT